MYRPSLRLPALAVATATFLSACTSGSPSASPSPSSTGSASRPQVAATSGSTASAYPVPASAYPVPASAYPVPASATPSALANLGTQTAGRWTITLNSVHRVSSHVVLVTATVTTATTVVRFVDFTESGYETRANPPAGASDTHEFSALTLTAGDDPTLYEPLRDAAGVCACTWGFSGPILLPGSSFSVFAYLSAPAKASTVTVTVKGFAPFVDVSPT